MVKVWIWVFVSVVGGSDIFEVFFPSVRLVPPCHCSVIRYQWWVEVIFLRRFFP